MGSASSTRRDRGSRRSAPGVVTAVAALVLLLGACGDADEPAPTNDATGTTATGPGADDTEATTATDDIASATGDAAADTTGDDAQTTEDDMDARPAPVPVPIPEPGLPVGPVPERIAQLEAVQDAIRAEAERRDVDTDEVEIVGYAEVTWSDGSLGCPKPGQMYTQALVPGRQLILAVDGEKASYHAATEGAFRYCARPLPPSRAENPDA